MRMFPPSWASLPPPPPLPYPTPQVITEQQAELHALDTRCLLAIWFTLGSAYVSKLLSQFIPHSSSHTASTYPFSTSASLFLGNLFLNIAIDSPSTGVLILLVWGVARTWAPVSKFSGFSANSHLTSYCAMKYTEGDAEFKPVGWERLTEPVMFLLDLRRLCEIGRSSLE